MPPDAPHNDETEFSIDHIPGVNPIVLKNGDLLQEDGHRIANIFEESADHIPQESSIALATRALRQAGYGLLHIPGKLVTLRSLSNTKKPHDREYVRMRNEKARAFVEDFLGRFVSEESEIHGTENLAQTMEENRTGKPVLMMGNHGSELDPVLASILLKREYANQHNGNELLADSAAEAREKLLAVIGHKVMLEKFRRTFSGAVHSLFTIATKYRENLPEEEKGVVSAYLDNVNTILRELVTHPEYLVMLFPEGGRTRNNQIGMQMGVIRAAFGKIIQPTFIEAPPNFLELEQGEKMKFTPEPVNIYFGKAFTAGSQSTRTGMTDFVNAFRDSLAEVGAPVDKYEWGVMQRTKKNGTDPRELQFHGIV
ncbi:hypothetical protein COU78_00930 [Candidatus Peregrinibacteria bacterium CG10_big_fil_rev_8_21_14_0_10_49_24]|nr:MAG: hypothetical protein COV83_01180 [Candidatus Peregrinibacteria bacterium CG11_big_fil_rev_8_21_14_0_20_49_14]PIR51513.1 MAG: hypothetical protein COU78_00930 [Candidatus Peregrinibacteria bacterium CG10_big_fil_rev_8_21_14_0_10_49_24]PJA67844.1 MAG: hypothetical protein CO157_02410 [Candidatus Peregrinibacteria bacterium CG_4_9_14_3_um_filter_49_12]